MDTTTTTPEPSRLDRLAAFLRRWFRRMLALCIAAVAAIWSFVTLTNLAEYLGFGPLSWMFPLCIDAVAALGMDFWMTRSPVWRLGRVLAMFGITVSVAGNVTDWLLRSVHPLAAVFGFIPPAVLAAVLGIMHRNATMTAELGAWLQAEAEWHAEQEEAREARRSRTKATRVEPAPNTPRVIVPRTVTKLTPSPPPVELPASDRERLELLERYARQNGKAPTKREAMDLLRVGSGKALELTRTVRETVTTETIETVRDQEASA